MNLYQSPLMLFASIIFLLPDVYGADNSARVFRAGAATSNITPWMGLSIAGHMRDRKVTDVHDELHVRALVLDNGETKIVFGTVDSCMVPREIFDAAKEIVNGKIGIPASHILLAATHSHSAPCTTPVFQTDADPDYNHFLIRRIADAVLRAHKNLEPARTAHGSASLPGEVFNRRWHMKPGTAGINPFGTTDDSVKMNPPRGSPDMLRPAGPIDPEIAFLAVENLKGNPLALLANYSLHYVGGTGGGEASADYFGIFANRIADLLGASDKTKPFVGMMSNGTSGDINNIDFRAPGVRQEPYEQMRIVARKAADVVHRAYQDLVFEDWVELEAAAREIDLGVRLPSASDLAEAREIVEAATGPDLVGYREIYARETILLSEYPPEVLLILQALRVGDLAVTAVPCEVFVEIGLELKEKSTFGQTFTIELANGYNGYLPTAEQHGYGGYETWRARSSYLEIGAAEKITDVVLELLEDVAGKK